MSIVGQTLYFTGNFPDLTPGERRLLLAEHGATAAARMGKSVTRVVCGDKAKPADIAKGKELGAQILTTTEFRAALDPQRSVFTLDDVHGEMDAQPLLERLKQKSWPRMERAQRVQLAALLHQHEAKHGVTEVHRFCTACMCVSPAAPLVLNQPFQHDDVINGFDLSPDGRYLAISSWVSAAFDPTASVLQVWDVAERRVLRQFVLEGGIGWRDRNEVQWSPDSKLLAASFNTNAVGVWELTGDEQPIAVAAVTDGWPEPPGFLWAADSSRLFIAAPFFAKRYADPSATVDENKGTWMPARGTGRCKAATNVVAACVEGSETDHPTKARAAAQKPNATKHFVGVNDTQIVLGPRSLEFTSAEGTTRFDFNHAAPSAKRVPITGPTPRAGEGLAFLLTPFVTDWSVPESVVITVGLAWESALSLHSGGVFWPARWATVRAYESLAAAEAVHGALALSERR